MKNKKIISLFVFPFLLTGCTKSSLSLEEATNLVKDFECPKTVDTRYNDIKISYYSELVFDKNSPNSCFYTEGVEIRDNIWNGVSDADFLEDPTIKYNAQTDRFLSVIPVFIDGSFFDAEGKFNNVKKSIINSYQSYYNFVFLNNDYNGITLSIKKISGYYKFDKTAYLEEDDSFDTIECFGRFNMEFVYNNEGFLVKEKIISSNYSTNNNAFIKLETNYEYSN